MEDPHRPLWHSRHQLKTNQSKDNCSIINVVTPYNESSYFLIDVNIPRTAMVWMLKFFVSYKAIIKERKIKLKAGTLKTALETNVPKIRIKTKA